jgi:hypothetical protein
MSVSIPGGALSSAAYSVMTTLDSSTPADTAVTLLIATDKTTTSFTLQGAGEMDAGVSVYCWVVPVGMSPGDYWVIKDIYS